MAQLVARFLHTEEVIGSSPVSPTTKQSRRLGLVPRRDGTPGVFRQFFTGVGYLFRGFATWRSAPGLMVLGMVPALIVGAALIAGFLALGINLENLAAAATPFAASWDEPYRTATRIVTGIAFLVVAFLIVVYAFTAITLAIGAPFYERIWKHVESRFGEVPDEGVKGFWHSLGKGLGDGLRMFVPTVLLGIPLFLLGLVPVAGQLLVPIVGAFVGGWFLAVELVGFAFDARGKTLRERRAALKTLRPMTLGFGVATYLVFLLPAGAVFVMPAAVAGATLLARRELGEVSEVATAGPAAAEPATAVDRSEP